MDSLNKEIENKIPKLAEHLKEGKEIKQIDRALSSLSNIEKQVIQYKCIQGMYYYEFTYKVFKSERQCKRIKSIVLNKIAIALGF